jgi:iron-sulfur cluster repair protein YtfE (RIC family)
MEIFLELKADSVEKKLAQYKQELLNHISSEEDIRYPKLLLNY